MVKRNRARGEGTIGRATDGRWVGRLSVGYQDGKQRRKSVYATTRREAHRKLTVLLNRQQTGQVIPAERQTLASYLDRWLEDVVRPSVRPLTHDSYETQVRVHIRPAIGRIPLSRLAPSDVQAFLNRKLEGGLSPRSVQYLRTVLRRALAQAVKWDLAARNVAALTNPLAVPKTAVNPFSPDETRKFLEAVADEPFEACFVVAATAGLRRAEVLGLPWSHVDLERGQLQVRGALQRVGGKLQLVETKSGRSRVVRLITRAVDALKRHRARQLELRLAAGQEWRNVEGLVFTNRKGTALEPRTVIRAFKRILAEAELRDVRFHDLRHGAATMMLSEGVNPKVVQEMLGHSQIGVTMDCYAHVFPDLQSDAVSRMNALLGTN